VLGLDMSDSCRALFAQDSGDDGTVDESAVRAAVQFSVEGLSRRGFVNYYGTQRLGDPTVAGALRPYEVGRALLRRDFAEVVRFLLTPYDSEPQVRSRWKLMWWWRSHSVYRGVG
jgi:tRNA(Glu) U13 pseudouridine synthase TruD